jgi:23S rRNA (guanosine2251-2'-O)-methyltransferase
MIIYGINPTLEALRAGRVSEIRVSARRSRRLSALLEAARQGHTPVRQVDDETLDRTAGGHPHQGVVAEVAEVRTYSVAELVGDSLGAPLVIVLDGIEDPRNFGAILRSADAAGADGVVHQTRRSAPASGAAAKASAGALAHVRRAMVVNISRALDELKRANVWTVGLAADAPQTVYDLDLTGPTAIVLGSEHTGLRRLVRKRCDWLAAIPMRGHVSSLNVSVAAGIALFEAVRQRRAGGS